jgi:hypothetical protein
MSPKIAFAGLRSEKFIGKTVVRDPARPVGGGTGAKDAPGWQPKRGIKEIVGNAWDRHKKHPQGYGGRQTAIGGAIY